MDIAQYRIEKAARIARGETKLVVAEAMPIDSFVVKVDELAQEMDAAAAEVKFEDTEAQE